MPDGHDHGHAGAAIDLDLRLVRYFTVLAEELNFGRAAERLYLTQPTLSRQLRRLEAQLGARLLERDAQGSRLTADGEAFLTDARELLALSARVTRDARTRSSSVRLTLGSVDTLVVTDVIRALRSAHPDVEVTTRHVPTVEGGDALRRHDVDVLVARSPLPFDATGLDVTVLYTEPLLLAVGSDHRLADRAAVARDDFAAEPLATCATKGSPDWTAFWHFEAAGEAARARRTIETRDVHDLLERVADSGAVAVFPADDRRVQLRDDVIAIPITGVEPCHVVVVTRSDDHRELVRTVSAHAAEQLRPASARVGHDGLTPPAAISGVFAAGAVRMPGLRAE
jgi:DNA-binding transcriptional LysR family regulator